MEYDNLDQVEFNGEYNFKTAAHAEKDWGMLDKYRGEWIKAAYLITKNNAIKLAEVESVVNDIVGVEFLDNSNVGSSAEALDLLGKTLNKVGQLLLLARMSKVELSENVLTKTFYAINELINEIRGSNTDNA